MIKKVMPYALSLMLAFNSFGNKANAGEFKVNEQKNPIYRIQIPNDLTKKDLINNVKLKFNGRNIYFRRKPQNYLEFKLFDPHSINKKGILSFSIENHTKYDDQTIRENFGELYPNYGYQPSVQFDKRQSAVESKEIKPVIGFVLSYDNNWIDYFVDIKSTDKTLFPEKVKVIVEDVIEKYSIENSLFVASNFRDGICELKQNKNLDETMRVPKRAPILKKSIQYVQEKLGKNKKTHIICLTPSSDFQTLSAISPEMDLKNTKISVIEIMPYQGYNYVKKSFYETKNSDVHGHGIVYNDKELKNTLGSILETDGFRYDYNKNQIKVFNKK